MPRSKTSVLKKANSSIMRAHIIQIIESSPDIMEMIKDSYNGGGCEHCADLSLHGLDLLEENGIQADLALVDFGEFNHLFIVTKSDIISERFVVDLTCCQIEKYSSLNYLVKPLHTCCSIHRTYRVVTREYCLENWCSDEINYIPKEERV